MIETIDDEFIQSVHIKFGQDLLKINLSNNGKITLRATVIV